jgi:hypothetical protein
LSTIRVDNFGPSAGGTTYSARGIAKAWASIAYSGGTPSFTESTNLSSVSDLGTGEMGVNYTSAFSSADKCSTGMSQINIRVACKRNAVETTSYDEYRVYDVSIAGVNPIDSYINVSVTGDLA